MVLNFIYVLLLFANIFVCGTLADSVQQRRLFVNPDKPFGSQKTFLFTAETKTDENHRFRRDTPPETSSFGNITAKVGFNYYYVLSK